jgi:predicted nuclease of predicted toxin-antitoxin system
VPIRFHLDEHIPASVGAGLRRRKIDVTTTAEAGLIGTEDAAQLSLAAASRRVLVTHDADFLRLHASGVSHAGIVYCPQGSVGIGEMLRRLVLIHDLLAPEEMVGRVEFR